nr:hypothetical protein CFP56_00429 [Quercus suber]
MPDGGVSPSLCIIIIRCIGQSRRLPTQRVVELGDVEGHCSLARTTESPAAVWNDGTVTATATWREVAARCTRDPAQNPEPRIPKPLYFPVPIQASMQRLLSLSQVHLG